MQSETAFAALFRPIVGDSPGSGIALIFLISGAMGVCVALGGYLFPAIRDVETILPDHTTEAQPLNAS